MIKKQLFAFIIAVAVISIVSRSVILLKSNVPPDNLTSETFFVDILGGNDSNPGTQDAPWKNVQLAAQKLGRGDTLYIASGDYRDFGPLIIKAKGTKENPIKIIGSNSRNTLIDSILLEKSAWVEISDLTIIGKKELPMGWKDMPEVIIDDPTVVINPARKWLLGRNRLVDQKYKTYSEFRYWDRNKTAGIALAQSQNVLIQDNRISLHSIGIELSYESSNIVIENNEITHTVSAIFGNCSLKCTFSFNDSVIRNNSISQSFREGIGVTHKANNNIVEGNLVEYTGTNHLITYNSGDNNVFRNNTVRYGGYYAEAMRAPGSSAISIHSAGTGTLVESNHISYHYDTTLRDGNGIIVDFTTAGAQIVNNIIYRTMGSGITSTESGNNTILHNTIVEPGYETSSSTNGAGFRTSTEKDINNIFANNIVYLPAGAGMFLNNTSETQKYLDHNLIYLPGEQPLIRIEYDSDFQGSGSGFAANSLLADPLFVDVAQLDFNLNSDSPAHQAGTSQYTWLTDFEGKPRKQLRPSLGAIE